MVFAVNGAFPARRYSTFVVSRHKKYRNLTQFLSAPIYIRHEMVKVQIVEVACTETLFERGGLGLRDGACTVNSFGILAGYYLF